MLQTNFIGRDDYAAAIIMRTVLFAVVTLAIPFAKEQLDGTLGEVAGNIFWVFFGLIGKTFIYIIFAVSLLGISTRRAATLGMAPLAGLALVLIVYADAGFGTTIANPALAELNVNTSAIGFPWHLTAGLVIAATLVVLADARGPAKAAERFGLAYTIWLAVICAFAAQTALALIRNLAEGISVSLAKGLSMLFGWYLHHLPVSIALALATVGASLWLVAIDRGWFQPTGRAPAGQPRSEFVPPRMTRPARKTFGLREP